MNEQPEKSERNYQRRRWILVSMLLSVAVGYYLYTNIFLGYRISRKMRQTDFAKYSVTIEKYSGNHELISYPIDTTVFNKEVYPYISSLSYHRNPYPNGAYFAGRDQIFISTSSKGDKYRVSVQEMLVRVSYFKGGHWQATVMATPDPELIKRLMFLYEQAKQKSEAANQVRGLPDDDQRSVLNPDFRFEELTVGDIL